MKNHKAFTLVETMITVVIIGLLLSMIVGAGGCSPIGIGEHYSDGVRTGYITKFSEKGLFIKSWEGEANLGGYREQSTDKGTNLVANVWAFSVQDPHVVFDLKDAVYSGKRVQIYYHQWWMRPWSISTSYVVYRVTDSP